MADLTIEEAENGWVVTADFTNDMNNGHDIDIINERWIFTNFKDMITHLAIVYNVSPEDREILLPSEEKDKNEN